MMTKTQKISLIVLATLLIGGFFAQRALLDAAATSAAEFVPPLAPHRALLTPEKGTVEVRRAGAETWTAITEETELVQGDSVRTGKSSSASLNLFEQGVARLDEKAAITLDRLAWDEERNSFVGTLLLDSGRLWSRLLDFMAPESSYDVRTSHLVATVRGTTFFIDASAAADDVVVVEHSVSVSAVGGGASADVTEWRKLHAVVPATGTRLRSTASAWTIDDVKDASGDAWVRGNLEKDQAYVERVEARLQGALERFAPRPDMSAFIEKKERASLSASGAGLQKIATRQLSRLAAEALMAAERGDTRALQATFARIESFCTLAKNKGTACRVHPRLIEFAAHRSSVTPALREAVLRVSPDMADTLRRIFDRRQQYEGARPDAATVSPSIGGAADIQPTTPSSGEAIVSDASPTAPLITTPVPVRLELSAQRFTFAFGQSGSFNAFLRWSDGRSEDVTKSVTWSLGAPAAGAGQLGAMRGNVFWAGEVEGQTTLTAAYSSDLGAFQASDIVRVAPDILPTLN